MINYLQKSDYKKSLWKNGQGTTDEIFIVPKTAVFPNDPFWFRISMATIQSENEFSLFPGYQRLLTVIDGIGLALNEKNLPLQEIIQFSGDERIFCKTLTSQTIDLGLIYDPQHVNAEMQRLHFRELHIDLDPQKHYFLVCADGLFLANGKMVNRFDSVYIHAEHSIELKSKDAVVFLMTMTLNRKKSVQADPE